MTYSTREAAQRAAMYKANTTDTPHSILKYPHADTYRVTAAADVEDEEHFWCLGTAQPLDAPVAAHDTARAKNPASYIYRSLDHVDALANFSARRAVGQSVVLMAIPVGDEAHAPWDYFVAPPQRWATLHSDFQWDDVIYPHPLEAAGCPLPDLPADPDATWVWQTTVLPQGATIYPEIGDGLDPLLAVLGIASDARLLTPQEPGKTMTHYGLCLPSRKSLDHLLFFITNGGAELPPHWADWAFQVLEWRTEGSLAQHGRLPGADNDIVALIPIADMGFVRDALRAAAERMQRVLAMSRHWDIPDKPMVDYAPEDEDEFDEDDFDEDMEDDEEGPADPDDEEDDEEGYEEFAAALAPAFVKRLQTTDRADQERMMRALVATGSYFPEQQAVASDLLIPLFPLPRFLVATETGTRNGEATAAVQAVDQMAALMLETTQRVQAARAAAGADGGPNDVVRLSVSAFDLDDPAITQVTSDAPEPPIYWHLCTADHHHVLTPPAPPDPGGPRRRAPKRGR